MAFQTSKPASSSTSASQSTATSSSSSSSNNSNSNDQPISDVPVLPVFLVAGLFVALCILVVAWRRLRSNQILLHRMRIAQRDRMGGMGFGEESYDEFGAVRRPVLWDVWAAPPYMSRGSERGSQLKEKEGGIVSVEAAAGAEVGVWRNVLPFSASLNFPSISTSTHAPSIEYDPDSDLPVDPIMQIPAFFRRLIREYRNRNRHRSQLSLPLSRQQSSLSRQRSPKDGTSVTAPLPVQVAFLIAMPSPHSHSHSRPHLSHASSSARSDGDGDLKGKLKASDHFPVEEVPDDSEVPYSYTLGIAEVPLIGEGSIGLSIRPSMHSSL